jgi:hypothetical protein
VERHTICHPVQAMAQPLVTRFQSLTIHHSPLAPFLLQLARVVHKRTAIQLPRPRLQHKSRASGPGFCGVYLSGFVSSARRRPVAYQPPVARIFSPVSPRTQASRGKTHTKISPPCERFSIQFTPESPLTSLKTGIMQVFMTCTVGKKTGREKERKCPRFCKKR